VEGIRGPTATSNWVIEGALMCGAQPDLTPTDLERIIGAGVSCFVCLQTELGGQLPYEAAATALFDGQHGGTSAPPAEASNSACSRPKTAVCLSTRRCTASCCSSWRC
jgi:hypothetical protein